MLRLALVGLDSSHADQYARLLGPGRRTDAVLVDLLDGPPERVAALRATAGLPTAPAGDVTAAGVDAVVVGHRHGSRHAAAAVPFLRAGVPVLVDKPLAASTADAWSLVAAARGRSAALWSASAYALLPAVHALGREAAAGAGAVPGVTGVVVRAVADPASPYDGLHFLGVHAVAAARTLVGHLTDVPPGAPWAPPHVERAGRAVRATTALAGVPVRLELVDPEHPDAGDLHARVVGPGGSWEAALPVGPDYLVPVLDVFLERVRRRPTTPPDAAEAEELVGPVRLLEQVTTALGRLDGGGRVPDDVPA